MESLPHKIINKLAKGYPPLLVTLYRKPYAQHLLVTPRLAISPTPRLNYHRNVANFNKYYTSPIPANGKIYKFNVN